MTALGGENGVVQKMRSVRPGQSSPIDGAIFTNLGTYELAPDSNVLTLCIPFLFRTQEEVDIVLEKMSGEISNAIQSAVGASDDDDFLGLRFRSHTSLISLTLFTRGDLAASPVFKTGAFNRSATSPAVPVLTRWGRAGPLPTTNEHG